jgi:hypothetical protein
LLQAANTHGVDVIDVRGISDLGDELKDEHDRAGQQELAAKHAAAFAAELLAQHAAGMPSEHLPSPPLPRTPDHFPPAAARELELLRLQNPELYRRLIDALTAPDIDIKAALKQLIGSPPDWMKASSLAWIAVGYWAVGQNLVREASMAFENAANSGAEPKSHWLAQAAVNATYAGEPERSETLFEQANALGAGDLFVEGMAAAAQRDLNVLANLELTGTGLTPEEHLTLEAMHAAALADLGRVDDALFELERLHNNFPDRGYIALRLAQVLFDRADRLLSHDRLGDLARSRTIAIQARNIFRSRRMDSSPAVALACQACLAEGDGRSALDIALPEPEGEATLAEANSQPVIHVAIHASLLIGASKLTTQLVAKVDDPFWKLLFEGTLAAQEPEGKEAAMRAFDRALAAATDDTQRWLVLVRLAPLGVWPLPADPTELQGIRPVDVDILLARSEVTRKEIDAAVARLRPWAASSLDATELLADIHGRTGNVEGAIETLRAGASRFQAPELLVQAVDIVRLASRWAQVVQVGRLALESLSPTGRATSYVRHRIIEAAARTADWGTVESFARTQLRVEPDAVQLRWALVIALHNRMRFDEAWRALLDGGLPEPADEYQARIKINLISRFEKSVEGIQQILELADRFRESEILVGSALGAIYTLRPQPALPAPLLAKLHTRTAEFFSQFPESRVLRQVKFDRPEEILSILGSQLASGRERLDDVTSQIQAGQIPYGMAATSVGKPYTAVLHGRMAGPLIGVPTEPTLAAVDLETASRAIGHEIVADISPLTVLVGRPELWRSVVSKFERIYIPDLAVADAVVSRDEAALRSTLMVTLDPGASNPRLVEIAPEVAERYAEESTWIADRALELEQAQVHDLSLFPDLDIERFGAWISAIELGKSRGLALYSDDLLVRLLARDRGVDSFGTFALARALQQLAVIDSAAVSSFDAALFDRFVVDLPSARDLIERAADRNGWSAGPATVAAGRPAVWSDASDAIRLFASLFRRIHAEAPNHLPFWLQVAAAGGSFLPPAAVSAFIGELLVTAILAANSNADSVSKLVEAGRSASAAFNSNDPLPFAAETLMRTASLEMSPPEAARFVASIFEPLSEEDKILIGRIIADQSEPSNR